MLPQLGKLRFGGGICPSCPWLCACRLQPIELIAQLRVLLLHLLMRLVQSLVLGNNALLALEHLVQVLELVHEEDGLVTHYRIDCVQGLNRQIKVTFYA